MLQKKRRSDNVSIKEAADRLNVHQDTVRAGLITGQLPIGSAVKCERNYSYIIPRPRFEAWITGGDLTSMPVIVQKLDDILTTINSERQKSI